MHPTGAWRLRVIGFAVAAILLADVGWMTFRRLADSREATARVQHTLLVRAETDGILLLLQNVETGARGFALAGTPSFLDPYQGAIAAFPARVARLRQLTADNPGQ